MESVPVNHSTPIVLPQGPDRDQYPYRFFLELAYRGTAYAGWQRQTNMPNTVQQELEVVLDRLLRHPYELMACGRTDAGVHASQQWVHVDTCHNLVADASWVTKFNVLLPEDIQVKSIRAVQHTAHARFSCYSRSYVYHIHRLKEPFRKHLGYYYPSPMRPELMDAACQILLRHTDFQSLSKVQTSVKSFICHISEARWEEDGHLLTFHVTANRFLRGMVRTIVGSMLDIGRGRMSPDQFEEMLLAKDRRVAGRAVPPDGLYLSAGRYHDHIWLPGEQRPHIKSRGRYLSGV